jgi:radical SAM-linked protein
MDARNLKEAIQVPGFLQRYRLRFKRTGPARALSHLQQIDALRRAIAASAWPVAKTASKKPRPRIAFGPAISVGYESYAEYCDVDMEKRVDVQTSKEALAPFLPEGFELLQAKSIPRFFPSLEQTLNAASYQIAAPALAGTEGKWDAFNKSENFMVTKKKEDRDVIIDVRPLVLKWTLAGSQLELTLRFGPGRTVKPEKLIQAVCGLSDEACDVGTPASNWRVVRSQMFFEKQTGELVEP